MTVVLYTSTGGVLYETDWNRLRDGGPAGVWVAPLPDVLRWEGRLFKRTDTDETLSGTVGYVEATVGTLPARTDPA